MAFFYDKVYTVSDNKNCFIDIYSLVKKAPEKIYCKTEFYCLKFLEELDNIIEKMKTQCPAAADRLKSVEIAAKHVSFLWYSSN